MNGERAAVMDVVPAMVGFARTLRSAGVPAGPSRVRAWALALRHLDPARTADVYWSGRLTLCSGPDELPVFDAVFVTYFGRHALPAVRQHQVPSVRIAVDQPDGHGDRDDTGDESAVLSGVASRVEVLRNRDVSMLTRSERAEINRLLAALRPTGPVRRTRRRHPARRGSLDEHRTVRGMLRHGGETAVLLHRRRVIKPRRLVLLVDVSGSMAPYSDTLLRFAHAACRRRPSTEVFTIGTRLTRITRELRQPEPDRALTAAGAAVPDWSGGTRLGDQLQAFLRRWGQRGVARGAVVVVASDGWERGDISLLAHQMAWLRRLAHRVVWVSPHADKPSFAPVTGGLQAVVPHVDALVGGHSVAALIRLADRLSGEEIHA